MSSLFDRPTRRPARSLLEYLQDTAPQTAVDWVPTTPPDLSAIPSLILNVETTGLSWATGDRPIGLTVGTLDGQQAWFLPWGFRGGNLDEATVHRWATRELRGKHLTNVNTRFDIHMLRVWGIDLETQGNTVSDVQHYAALLDDHRQRFALDVLAADYLGGIIVPRLDERRMADYHASEVAPRAVYQVQLVAQLRAVLWPLLDAQDLQRVRQLEDDVIYPVVEMEKNGARLDPELLERYRREATQTYQTLIVELAHEVGFSFDATRAGWTRLFAACHQDPCDSYAEDIVGAIDHPIIQKAHFAAQVASLNSKIFTPYTKLIDAHGILRYDIHQLRGDAGGTVSGRFSIGYVQQVPNEENHRAVFGPRWFPRRLYRPERGLYLAADAAQIEYRLFAHRAKNPTVLQAYRDNPQTSFHQLTWAMMRVHKPDILYPHLKSLNFMKMYGGGLIKIAVMMGDITAAEGEIIRQAKTQLTDPRLATAREIDRIYARVMPEVNPLTRLATHLAQSQCNAFCQRYDALHRAHPHQGYVSTILGRRSRFPKDFKTYRGLNRIIQGSAADIMKQKLVELHRQRHETGFVIRMTVHDEVCGEVPDADAARRVGAILNHQSFPELTVPILWDVETGPNWAMHTDEPDHEA